MAKAKRKFKRDVCSLDQAKKFQALGIEIKGIYCYCDHGSKTFIHRTETASTLYGLWERKFGDKNRVLIYPTYTLQELSYIIKLVPFLEERFFLYCSEQFNRGKFSTVVFSAVAVGEFILKEYNIGSMSIHDIRNSLEEGILDLEAFDDVMDKRHSS